PGTWGDLVYYIGKLAYTNTAWANRAIGSITQTTGTQGTIIDIAAGFSPDTTNGSIIAVKNLDTPVDITRANQIGFWIMSTANVTAAKLKFVYDDFQENNDGSGIRLLRVRSLTGATHFTGGGAHVPMPAIYDGDTATAYSMASGTSTEWTTADYVYVVAPEKFTWSYWDLGTKNDAASVLSAEYFNGKQWTALTIDDDGTDVAGDTMKQDGAVTHTEPNHWAQYTITDATPVSYTGYIVRYKVSVNLDDPITINQINTTRSNDVGVALPALVANVWQYVVLSNVPEEYPKPDDTSISVVGFELFEDITATIYIRDGIDLLYNTPDWKALPSNDKITNLIAHNGNVDEPRTNPWIFTEGSQIYEMQSQNDDQFIPVTVGEMGALKSENTGRAVCVNDVYLYFSLGEERIERWFNNSLDDIGPDGDFYYG
ncbi:unnamed protein product, partial [marine sediment metagenome]